mmetsp:Transcript_14704/g.32007  ORF Transcript_14704/g.32007 Transcript_14704/m.32007 type:complete len:229 (-) Transcript_14704:445-1131(-)
MMDRWRGYRLNVAVIRFMAETCTRLASDPASARTAADGSTVSDDSAAALSVKRSRSSISFATTNASARSTTVPNVPTVASMGRYTALRDLATAPLLGDTVLGVLGVLAVLAFLALGVKSSSSLSSSFAGVVAATFIPKWPVFDSAGETCFCRWFLIRFTQASIVSSSTALRSIPGEAMMASSMLAASRPERRTRRRRCPPPGSTGRSVPRDPRGAEFGPEYFAICIIH